MDKQKQMIEEMAQCKNEYGFVCGDCVYRGGCERYSLAEELFNAGYRKIPENAVVLDKDFCDKREEMIVDLQYDKFELENEISEKDNKIALLEETIDCIKFNVDFTRKETAEKFAERLKSKRKYLTTKSYNTVEVVCIDDIDEICKEFTEKGDLNGKSRTYYLR